MLTALTGWLAGLLLGMRHALEPDHLAAVSTLVAERPGLRRGLWLGAVWGLGHTLALLGVGAVLALLQVSLPPRLADAFELLVALMLVVLGVRALVRALRLGPVGDPRLHAHAGRLHHHAGAEPHVHLGRFTFEARSLAIGLVHGLAGSGALTALVLAELPTTAARLGYIALFGLGSVVGMALLSSLAGWPLERLARARRLRLVSAAAGAVAAGLGVAWAWPIVARW